MANVSKSLIDLPNIGKSIAADLARIGIQTPAHLQERDPLTTFWELAGVMGKRHDPCVLYTLLAVKAYLDTGESKPWWSFTAAGKSLLATPHVLRGSGCGDVTVKTHQKTRCDPV